MPSITVDGAHIPAEKGETILEAMQRAAVPFPFMCHSGNCGTCKCEYVSGEIIEVDHTEFALSPAERARNIVLGCRTQVWGDVEIRRIDDGELVAHPARALDCRVAAIDDLTHDIRRFRLALEAGGPFEFSAGQYAKVVFATGNHREYSMANPPHDPVLEFHVRRTADGMASRLVFTRLAVGDTVRVEGPLGSSYLRERHTGPILLVAGGSGMAPILSILESALHLGMTQPIRLYFGVREARDYYGGERLAALRARFSNFHAEVVLSAPDAATSDYRTGMLHEVIAADWSRLAIDKAYLAGPPVMVEAVSDLLRERGIAMRDIHADAYYTEADKARLQPTHDVAVAQR